MGKILIRLEIPSVKEQYDLFVPTDIDIKSLTNILANGIQELSNGRYGTSGKEMLMNRSPVSLLNPNKTLDDYCIKDGSVLIII